MKRVLVALLMLFGACRAQAVDLTDIWFNSSQAGYGFNVVQSDNTLFITFFIYGPNGAPTWYVATVRWNGTAYTGDLLATTGTFFGAPWNGYDYDVAGTATFTPSSTNNYQATLSYTVPGVGASTVPLERQTLTTIAAGGNYSGGQPGSYSGCNTAANNGGYLDRYDLTVTHSAGPGVMTFEFNYVSGLTCTLSGTYTQNGQYYRIPNASYKCSDGVDTTAQMSEIKATSLGLEGRFTSSGVGDNCVESAIFGGALIQ
jgi:hypothetical protein